MTTMPQTSVHLSPPAKALRTTGALALLGGAALVVDTVTITILNRSFDPLDSVLFLLGFVSLLATGIALSVHLTAGRHGASRAAAAVGVLLAYGVVLGLISTGFDQLGRHAFSASNKGLHGEWSFFSIGVCLLLLAGWARNREARQRP